jgi:hypothetical protein
VHRHGRVREHRLRTHRGNGQRTRLFEWVFDVVERVRDLAVLDLQIRDGRLGARVPVDHVVVAVDQPFLVEVDEDPLDRLHIALVQREALVLVVRRGAEALELLHDRAAVALAPFPHPALELLAAQLCAARALRGQLPLDLRLRRDAGVIGAEDPFRAAAVHAVVTDQHILHRGVQRVPHVQRAGDVRRRDRDRVVVGRGALRLGVEIAGLQPPREHARLDLLRVIAGALFDFVELPAGHAGNVIPASARSRRPAAARSLIDSGPYRHQIHQRRIDVRSLDARRAHW